MLFSKKQTAVNNEPPEVPETSQAPDIREAHKRPSLWKSIDWKLMLTLLFPSLLETLDYTVVAAAQPRIASIFNALNLQSYIGTSYLLSSAVFLPFFASVADIYGRYFGLQVSLLLFLIGSAIATGAVNMPMVLAGRGISGIGGAGLLTVVRTILSDSSSLDANNIQQTCLFMLYSTGFVIGPVIGGFLVSANFRWVFAINLPCIGLAIIFSLLFLRKSLRRIPQPNTPLPTPNGQPIPWYSKLVLIDWIGTFMFCIGGILILLALNWGPDDNWKSARVIASIVIGVLALIVCMIWENILERKRATPAGTFGIYSAQPMIPMDMFNSFDICATQYGALVSGIVMFVMFYFLSIFATIVSNFSSSKAGIQLLYFAPGLGSGSFLAIGMIKRYRQPIYPIVVGSVIMTIALGLVSMAVQNNKQAQVDGFLALSGFGVALTTGPIAVHARFKKPDHVAITNAVLLFARSVGGTIGLAQCFTVLNSKINSYITAQINSGAITGSDLADLVALLDSGGLSSLTTLSGLPPDVQTVVRAAFQDGLRWSFLSLVPWTGLAAFIAMFLSDIPDTDNSASSVQSGNSTKLGDIEMEPKEETEAMSARTEYPPAKIDTVDPLENSDIPAEQKQ